MKLTKKQLLQGVSYLFFLLIGIYFLKKTFDSPEELQEIVTVLKGVNLWVILCMILISIVGHIIRSLRWKLLLNNVGEEAKVSSLYWSLLVGYFINYLIPRLGEVYRCVSLNKTSKIPTAKILATVIIERVIDLFSLLIILPTVFFIQYERFGIVLDKYIYPFLLSKWEWIQMNYAFLIAFSLVSLVILIIIKFSVKKESKLFNVKFINDLWEGLSLLKKVNHLPAFITYTLFIWAYYFVTNYACLYALDSVLTDKWSAAISTGAFGSIAKSLPIAGGGMGAYHKLVTEVLLVYGVSTLFAKSMSILFHGTQMIFQFVMGIFGMLFIYTRNN